MNRDKTREPLREGNGIIHRGLNLLGIPDWNTDEKEYERERETREKVIRLKSFSKFQEFRHVV